jgi:hypothetical protein
MRLVIWSEKWIINSTICIHLQSNSTHYFTQIISPKTEFHQGIGQWKIRLEMES